MRDSLRQLWLLTRKNLILTRRNKVWTLFELILPILFLLPVTLLVVRGGTVQLSSSWSIESVPLEGGAGDFSFGEFKSIPMRWCGRRLVFIAYSTHENRESVEDIMNELAARFSSSSIKVNVEYIKDEAHMLDELRADAPYSDDFGTCSINKFAGGLIFNQFDTKAAKLDYKLLIPAGTSWYDRWNEEWGDPFDLYRGTARWFRVPYEPPYWSSAFLSIQYCTDSLFIEASSAKITIPPKLRLRRMPVASYSLNGVAVFLAISSYVWGLCVFILVMHTTREIVSEKSTVKDFLSVMGLSTPVFYLSHVLYATGKCFIVFLICVTPLTFHIEPVNVSLFLVTIALYGVSAIVFAALISSLFKTPNTALKEY